MSCGKEGGLSNRFKIVVTAYNCSKWLGKNLGMIERQTYRSFDVCIVDDASTDPQQQAIIAEFSGRNGWRTIFNAENQGALFNIVAGIKALECSDDDIIVQMDGDDWLFDRRVLRLLDLYYRKEDIYLTYGQYYSLSHRKRGICAPVTEADIEARRYRQMPWQFSALRTFKYLLWRQIKDEDLRDRDGSFYRVSWDMAFMYPMLEMAGRHVKFIPDILYTYNDLNPICDLKVRRDEQVRCEHDIRSRSAHQCLQNGFPKPGPWPLRSRLELAWIRTVLRLKSWRVRDRRGRRFFG
jgi:glycosyltransferase involved in cell wall biosynthesis